MNYELLYNLEKEENEKLQKQIRELTIDNELYKIRLKNAKELSFKSKATLAPRFYFNHTGALLSYAKSYTSSFSFFFSAHLILSFYGMAKSRLIDKAPEYRCQTRQQKSKIKIKELKWKK